MPDEPPESRPLPPGAAWPRVVALVGSAGSFNAVRSVLHALPTDFPSAVIVLIHQSPERPAGLLASLLAGPATLPTTEIDDGARLRAGHVFIVPAGSHGLVRGDATLQTIEAGSYPPSRPSADLLLATLAIAAGRRATAVILSGSGQDGATGATAIRHNGGRVIVTDRASSDHFSMPEATIERDHIRPEVVDVAEVAALLCAVEPAPGSVQPAVVGFQPRQGPRRS